jgi:hypothetical protein
VGRFHLPNAGGSMVMFGCVFVVLSSFAMVFCSFF